MSRRARLVAGIVVFSGLFLGASAAFAVDGEVVVPRPHGWIGTELDWARALGIAFALLDLVLILSLWRNIRNSGLTPGTKQTLFFAVAVLPLAIVFFGYSYGLEASKSVEACGSCHTMTPYVRDLRDPKSENLAAVHYKNRFIQENHCYTCHTDYGMFGTVKAKWEGLGHTVRYTTGAYT
ncbi:MAG: NapC/NirT family cytochrome c, partial [Acidobacteriota bacterium]|nr:NapC/NirT family cytochrome c [Acidobacteriota bacterium]